MLEGRNIGGVGEDKDVHIIVLWKILRVLSAISFRIGDLLKAHLIKRSGGNDG
jgi:hypothetical protein